jgi:hypothetical protein
MVGIRAASVRRWLADVVAGRGLGDAFVRLPGRRATDPGGAVPTGSEDEAPSPEGRR